MFDVGFSEIIMVALVALLVIGPEKLPKAARIAGFWVGKTRAMVSGIKAEIKQELRAEELRQIFQEQTEAQALQQLINDSESALHDFKQSAENLAQPEKPNDER